MAWVTIDRETIKAELARHYGNANHWTVSAWKAQADGNKDAVKTCVERRQNIMGRAFGVEALILRGNGITVSTEYIDEPQYHETMCPRFSAISIKWTDAEPAERVEIRNGETPQL